MKKFHLILYMVLILVAGCAAPGDKPIPAVASEIPAPSPTVVPSATALPATPTAISTPPGLPGATLPDGLGVAIHYEFFEDTYFPAAELTLLEEANLGFVRDEIWPGAACGKRPWCFEYFDRLVTMMSRMNMRVVFLLRDYENSEIGTVAGREAFAQFARDAAARYKGEGVIWEIWNEPELDEYWRPYANPRDYALLVEEVVPAIRTADPGAVIIGPSLATLSTVYNNNAWDFLTTIGEAGTLSQFDAVDVHLYNGGNPESQIENLRKLRRLIDSFVTDRRLPITSTEWGYTTGGPYYGHRSNEEEQPKYLVRSYLVKASHEVYLSIWYVWKNDDWEPNGPAERNFGVITSAGEPKPGYQALKTLTTTLDGYQFIRRVPTESIHDYLLLFRKGDAGILAAWTITAPHVLMFPDVAGEMESVSMFGERQILLPGQEGLSLELSDAPQYLLLADGAFGGEEVLWKPEGTFFRLDNANHGEIPIEIENPSDQEQTFVLEATLNSEPIGAAGVVLDPHETGVIRLPVDLTAKSEELDFLVKVTVATNGTLQGAWVWVQR